MRVPSGRKDTTGRRVGRRRVVPWAAARDLAAERTRLYPGDVLAGPALGEVEVAPGEVDIQADGIGILDHVVA